MSVTPLFDGCFLATALADGTLFPVGDRHNFVVTDFANVFPRFAASAERYAGQTRLWWTLREGFEERAPQVDPDLLFALQTFVGTVEPKRGNIAARGELFAAYDHIAPLSVMYERDAMGDAEHAVLAQKYLESKGIEGLVYFGLHHTDAMPEHERRMFLAISHQGQDYIWDPFASNKLPDGERLVALYETGADGASRDVLTGHKAYFGMGLVPEPRLPERPVVQGPLADFALV